MRRDEFLLALLGSPLLGQQKPPQLKPNVDSRGMQPKRQERADARVPGVGAPPSGRRRALCLGNNAYRFAGPLRNATRDATDMGQALRKFQFETTLVTEAGISQAKASIQKFTEATEAGDSVMFFYAGHGFQLEGGNFLVPTDFKARDEESAKTSAIQVETVLQGFVRKRAHLTVMMLDACRNNPFREATAPTGLAPAPPVLGTLAMFATSAGKTADDNPSGNNGLFTSKLLENFDSTLPLQALVRKVRDQVFDASGGRQRPYVQEDLVGDFYFKPAGSQSGAGDGPVVERPKSDESMGEGLTLYRSGDYAGALAAFSKVTKSDPSNVYAWNAAGAALAQLGRKSQAVEFYGHAIDTNPAYVAAYVNRGLAYLGEARYPQAIQDFSWAIEEDGTNPLLFQWRGQAYLGVRSYREGLADLDRAVLMDAGSPESFLIRARLHRRMTENEAALADVNRALQLKRGYWQAFEERASVYRAMGQSGRAAADDKAAGELKAR